MPSLPPLSREVLPHAAPLPAQQHLFALALRFSYPTPSTHLHQLHDGHKICQRDLTPNDKSLVLQKPLLKLLQGSEQPLHNLLELLGRQGLPCDEGNQHLRREGTREYNWPSSHGSGGSHLSCTQCFTCYG